MLYDHTIIQKTATMMKEKFLMEWSGHDRWHIYRVWQNALHIHSREWWDKMIIELGALLHDIADRKFHDGDDYAWGKAAQQWLQSLDVWQEDIEQVIHIVDSISYKWAHVENKMTSKEWLIVQDADRLDAIGAVGIARCFAYWWSKQRPLRDPESQAELHTTAEAYKSSHSGSINHFYEKLLLLKDIMNTDTAKQIAQWRHAYMEWFLTQFFAEWEGTL